MDAPNGPIAQRTTVAASCKQAGSIRKLGPQGYDRTLTRGVPHRWPTGCKIAGSDDEPTLRAVSRAIPLSWPAPIWRRALPGPAGNLARLAIVQCAMQPKLRWWYAGTALIGRASPQAAEEPRRRASALETRVARMHFSGSTPGRRVTGVTLDERFDDRVATSVIAASCDPNGPRFLRSSVDLLPAWRTCPWRSTTSALRSVPSWPRSRSGAATGLALDGRARGTNRRVARCASDGQLRSMTSSARSTRSSTVTFVHATRAVAPSSVPSVADPELCSRESSPWHLDAGAILRAL